MDVEVFLEAVGLEEVGEFEGADIAAPLPWILVVMEQCTRSIIGFGYYEGWFVLPLTRKIHGENCNDGFCPMSMWVE